MVQDRVVKSSDLFWFLVSRWKWLVAALVIGALVLGGYKAVSAGRQTAPSKAAGKAESFSSFDQAAVSLYLEYLILADAQREYVQNAEVMQLDPNNAYESGVSLLVSGGEDDVKSALSTCADILQGAEEQYSGRMVFSVSGSVEEDSKEKKTDEIRISQTEELSSGIVRIRVYGEEAASCEAEVSEVKDRILSAGISSSAQITETGAYTSGTEGQELFQLQKQAVDNLYSMTNSMNNIQKTFSEDALSFVTKTMAAGDPQAVREALQTVKSRTGETPAKTTSSGTKLSKRSLIRYGILGAGAGLIAMAVLLALYYVFSGKLRREDDTAELFLVPCLGKAADPAGRKKTGPDRAISRKWHGSEDSPEVIAANICLSAKNAGITELYATGTVFGEPEKQFAGQLKELLEKKGIALHAGERLLADAASVEKMASTGAALLIERPGRTSRTAVGNGLRYCRENSIRALGLVLLV